MSRPKAITQLCREFAARPAYDREFFERLLATARGKPAQPWAVRRLAALMLERQVASLITDRAQDLDFALTMLGLKSAGTGQVHEWLLEEGFTSTAPSEFARQLLRKIQRRPFARDLEDLIHRSTQDCRLVLARYLFEPAEVMRQALSQVRVTQGVADKVRGQIGRAQ